MQVSLYKLCWLHQKALGGGNLAKSTPVVNWIANVEKATRDTKNLFAVGTGFAMRTKEHEFRLLNSLLSYTCYSRQKLIAVA